MTSSFDDARDVGGDEEGEWNGADDKENEDVVRRQLKERSRPRSWSGSEPGLDLGEGAPLALAVVLGLEC